MKYGIQEDETGLKCANCNRLISQDGTIPHSFCPDCGNALDLDGINEMEKRIKRIEKDIFYTLKDISDNEQTDSLKKCMKKYFEDRM